MSNRIAILPDHLVNQIAAGEVVERPASVVKELVENALDAGAGDVRTETAEGGRRLIRVSDDGEGMGPEDARASLQRHATSKIRTVGDLHGVVTYGFRGEALPSIGSVSKMRLLTKRRGDATATEIRFSGGVMESVAEAGAPDGTLVEIRDLFFNTPARLKFLRRPAVEASHVTDVIERLALARPDVGFTLAHGERVLLNVRSGSSLEARIAEILGASQGEGLLPLDLQARDLALEGFLSPPDRTQPTARAIYLFVNGRPVRDRPLHHAIISASREFIPQDRFPVAVIHLTMAPETVDGNVHPAKLEVRFREARAVYDGVRRAVLAALRSWSPVSVSPDRVPRMTYAERVQESLDRFTARPTLPGVPTEALGRADAVPAPAGGSLRYLGQAHETYLVFEAPDGLLLVDQHAAHERVVFERLRAQAREGGIVRQTLLVPRTVDLSTSRRANLDARKDQMQKLGFELEPFGGGTLAVKSVPALLQNADLDALLAAVADDLGEGESPEAADRAFHRALATVACHAVVRAGQRLDRTQVDALLEQMGETPGSGTCPHGRPVAIRLPRGELERRFRRS